MKKSIRSVFQIKITMVFLIFIIGCQIISNPVTAEMARINDSLFDEEFDSGVIASEWMNISYAWVQTNETALLSLATYDDVYKFAPFHPFFGQQVQLEDTEYFVGNIIAGFELYEDLNNNYILDSQEELSYFIILNASQNFIPTPVEQIILDSETASYTWKYSYMEVDGFLSPFSSSTPPFVMRKTVIDSVNLSFGFEVTNQTSELKLTIEMGEWDAYEFYLDDETYQEIRTDNISLDNYGLSILFGTTISCIEPIEFSTINATNGITNTILQINDTRIFDLSFNDNYDLGINGSSLPSYTAIADINSLYEEQLMSWSVPTVLFEWWNTFFSSFSSLPTIPPLGVQQVSFLYRMCYPVWNGIPFHHDPRYKAYFSSDVIIPTSTTTSSTENTDETVTFPVPGFLFLSIFYIPTIQVVNRRKQKKLNP